MIKISEKCGETLFATARHKALFGGRGAGKSWSVALYLVVRADELRKLIVCARQFQNSIRDSSKELIERRIHNLGLSDHFIVTNQTIVHRDTGSEFIFVGLERNIDSIRSLEGADIVWIEEARTISNSSMEVLLPTIRKKDSEFIWCWNPELPTDPVDVYFRGPQGPPPNSIVTRVDYNDNPFFDETALRPEMELLLRHNKERHRHVWLGEYDTCFVSRVFTNVIIDRVAVPADVPSRYGLDFGFNDPAFIVKVYVLEATRQLYIAAEASGVVPLDQLPLLIDSVVHDSEDLIWSDSSQPGIIEYLQNRGYGCKPVRKAQGSIRTGISFLQGYQIVIDPECEAMREESRLYSWPTDRITGAVISGVNPIDSHNHGFDAVRYATSDLIYDPPLAADDPGVLWLWGSRRQRIQNKLARP